MNFNNTVKLFVITLISFVLIGCASAPPTTVTASNEIVPNVVTQSNVNNPKWYPLIANGEATVVVRETVTDTERTYQSAMSKEQARLELELAKLQAEVEIARAKAHASAEKAKARAENPCSSWFLAPSYCYGYQPYSGGGYYGPAGSNRSFQTGSGRSNLRFPRGPSGGNVRFSGGNSGETGGSSGGGTGGVK